jgi:hypothetical protein
VTGATYTPWGALTAMANGTAGINVSNTFNKRMQPLLLSATSSSGTIMSLCYDFHIAGGVNQAPCVFKRHFAREQWERLPGRQQPGHHAHTALCLRHPESSFEWAIKRLGQPELGRKFLNRCLGPSLCQIRYRRQSHYRAA